MYTIEPMVVLSLLNPTMVAVNYNIIIIQFLLSVRIDVFILLFQRKTIENSVATIIILLPCTYIIPVFVLVMFEI